MATQTFDAAAFTAANTGRGRPDEGAFGGDHTDTVYFGSPGALQWVRFGSTGAAGNALKGLRTRLSVAATEAEWWEIARRWYDEQ